MIDALKFRISGKNDTNAAFSQVTKNLRGVDGMLATVQQRTHRWGRSMRNVGAGMSAGVTAPIAILGKQSLGLFQIQEEAEAAVRQVVKSTGGAAGETAKELFQVASGLQKITAFGDEDILRNVTVPMATFTKIAGPQFQRGQVAVLDMATALKMDLKSASIQVGKALNDPIKGVTALGRAGVVFSDDQKGVIQSLVETGDVASAQVLILKELETEFGGQAAAFKATTAGKIGSLKNAIGDLKEELGAQIVPFMTPVINSVTKGVEWFGKLSPEVKKNIVVFGGLAAVAGPALSILGLGVMAISPLIGILGAVLSPIGLLVGGMAAIGVAAYKNWDKIKEAYPGIASAIEGGLDIAMAAGNLFMDANEVLWTGVGTAALAGVDVLDKVLQGDFKGAWDAAKGYGVSFWESYTGLVDTGVAEISGYLKGLKPGDILYDIWNGVPDYFFGLFGDVKTQIETKWAEVTAMISAWPDAFLQIGGDIVDGLKQGIAEKWQAMKAWVVGLADDLPDWMRDTLGIHSPSRVFKEIGGNIVDGLVVGIDGNSGKATGALRGLTNTLKNIMSDGSTGSDGGDKGSMIEGVKQIDGAVDGVKSRFDQARQSAGKFFADAIIQGKSLKSVMSDLLGRAGSNLLSSGISSLFGSLFGDSGGGWLSALFNANGNVFANGQLVSAYASGGVVQGATAFPMAGSRIGVMGEAGPEAIMPLTRVGGKLGVRALSGDGGAKVIYVPQPYLVRVDADDGGRLVGRIEAVENMAGRADAEFKPRVINTIIRAQKDNILK